MNILIVSNMYPSEQKPYSGLFVVNQVNAIQNKLEENDVLDFYYMERTFTNKIGSIVKYLKFFINFIFFIRKKNIIYDIVHIHYYFPTIYIALIYKYFFNKNVKIIVTFHGFDMYRTKKTVFFKYPFKHIHLSIGVSNLMCSHISLYYTGRIKNISAGINEVFQKTVKLKCYDLIFVGSFYLEKGFDRLCSFLNSTKNTYHVCIIGSGYLEEKLSKVIIRNQHKIDVFNNLPQEEIVSYLNKSKMLINLSREESFGLSMAEAMACGVPVIATDTDGSREQIKEGYNGFLITSIQEREIDILQELDNLITKLLNNDTLLKSLSENALKSSEKYKLSNVSNEIKKLYERLSK